jgi:hypothetical protein
MSIRQRHYGQGSAEQTQKDPDPRHTGSKLGQPATKSSHFADVKIQHKFKIQALACDGSVVTPQLLNVRELRDQVVELEFENGQK